jgi:hypothetical protein
VLWKELTVHKWLPSQWLANTFVNRVFVKSLCALLLPLCALWAAASAWQGGKLQAPRQQSHLELPQQWQGAPLRVLALSEVEQRFAQRFPGQIARMTDGQQVLVLRAVDQPTRMLHPAADCYRGLGYRISAQQLWHDEQQALWRCFVAERGGQRLRVCERIVDTQGQAYTDTSAWFWAAQMGQTQGPWKAITVAQTL